MTDPSPEKKPPTKAQVARAVMARLESAGVEAAILIIPCKGGVKILKHGNPCFLYGMMVSAYPALTGEEPPEPEAADGE